MPDQGPGTERRMTEAERQFYKTKMKKIKAAIQRGDEEAANRHAFELRDYFGIE